jgi:recombination protein RecR
MDNLPKGIVNIIEFFSKFQGIGKKTATRMALSLLNKTPEYHSNFSKSIANLSSSVSECTQCFHLCDKNAELCFVCINEFRQKNILCIVESALDLLAMEKSNTYKGLYFVLGGVISPMDGIGPEEIRVKKLINHLEKNIYDEVIFALSSTMEGESTTVYITDLLTKKSLAKNITRIARGISLGSSIQYTDENTLQRAYMGRSKV